MAALANQRRRRKRQRELLQAETAERLKEPERRSRAAVAAAERERAPAAPGAGLSGPSGGKTGAGTRILLGRSAADELTPADPAPGRKPRTFVYRADKPILDSYGLDLLRVSDEEASRLAGKRAAQPPAAAPRRLAQAVPPPASRTPSQPGTSPQASAGPAPSGGTSGQPLRTRPDYLAKRDNKKPDMPGRVPRVTHDDWKSWSDSLDRAGVSRTERRIYQDIFSHEGGTKRHGTTVAGIRIKTLADLHGISERSDQLNAAKIPPGMRPDQLTPEQRIDVYRIYLDQEMKDIVEKTGKRAHEILADMGDGHAASAFADTLFREGTRGARMIQSAINQLDTEKGAPVDADENRLIPPQTLRAFNPPRQSVARAGPSQGGRQGSGPRPLRPTSV